MPPGRARSSAREAASQGVRPRRPAETALQELELQLRERLQVTTLSRMSQGIQCLRDRSEQKPCRRPGCIFVIRLGISQQL